MELKIFVILINYKNAKLTIDCIDSIYKANNEVRIVVVDNNSEDDSVIRIRDKFDDIIIIESKTNLGFSGGNNLGIKYALNNSADIIMLLNNDTIVDKNIFNNFILHNDGNSVLVPKIYFFGTDILWYAGGTVSKITGNAVHYGYNKKDDIKYCENKFVNFATGCCVWIPRGAFEKIGYMDEEYFLYFEDVDYSLKMNLNSISIKYISPAVVWHKVSSSSGGNTSKLSNYYNTRNRLMCIDIYSSYFYTTAFWYSVITRYIRIFQKQLKGDISWKSIRKGIHDYKKGISGKVDVYD